MPAEVNTSHNLLYETGAPITAKALVDSLMALDGFVSNSTSFLRRLMPDLPLSEAQLLITRVEAGSYKENFIVRLVLGKGAELEKNIETLRKKLNVKEMDAKKVVGLAIAAAMIYGAIQYLTPSAAPSIHIENSFNSLGAELNLKPEEIRAILDAAFKQDTEQLKKLIVKLAHPGGDTKGERLVIDGKDSLSIPKDVIQAIPTDYSKDEPVEPFRDFDNAQIVVRAADLDRPSLGWAAIVPESSDKRLPLALAEGLDAAKVPIGKYFHGDITIAYRVDNKTGAKHPKRILLRKLIDPSKPGGQVSGISPSPVVAPAPPKAGTP